jgi:hypothetical protein
MLFSRCQRVLTGAALVLLTLCATASEAVAKPKPGRGFRLFASAQNIFTVNRVQCRVFSTGQICATGSSTVGGGIWPRGTANQYIFGSGINIAGVIEPGDRSANGFAGDTAGAFFNNTGGGDNAEEIRPIFDSNDPADAAVWPAEARVPCAEGSTSAACLENALGSDPQGELFDPALQGSIAASQGDLWFLNWEGNPTRIESRSHPMGVAVETRALGWNFPQGNEDILYFLYTFYNVTSTEEEDYAAIRPSLRPILLEKAAEFQATNAARFGINLPAGGYAINDLFASFVADMDVANFASNYAAVNVPFSLGVTYESVFSSCADLACTFPPEIFGIAPFFPGIGFIGVKYLGSPDDPETGEPVGLTLFGTFSNSAGSLQDPNDDKQLYRYITGGLLPTDGACSLPNPLESKICFVNISSPADMRFFQSSGPINLPPGGSGTIVVAYIFAAPVSAGGCPGPSCDVKPAATNADLTILGDPVRMANGVNKIDTMMGYAGNINGQPRGTPLAEDPDPTVVTQDEFLTVPGSLLRKAQTAQSVFDNKFLLPFAPERPEFFLVPGDNQVSVLWQPSPTEDPSNPDPFFVVASDPSQPLYDPNFRANDVEGYRVYRGRVDNPTELQLLAQFDYGPDPATGKGLFNDFRGTLNPTPQCAPELGVFTACDPALQPPPPPGTPFTGFTQVDLTGTVTQINPGNRVLLASGEAQILPGTLDTAFTDIAAGRLAQGVTTTLANTGVPFVFIDQNVRNSLRYFYAVTAFDVNSAVSGPSSLESARVTKAVTPTPAVSNDTTNVVTSQGIFARGELLEPGGDLPTIHPANGTFSGPFPPANGASVQLGALVPSILGTAGAAAARLDSITLGSVYDDIPHLYWFTAGALGLDPATSTVLSIPIDQPEETGVTSGAARFQAQPVLGSKAARFGGNGNYVLPGALEIDVPGPDYLTLPGRGCVNAALGRPGFGDGTACNYPGSRWFAGPSPANNETQADPIACHVAIFSGEEMPCFNNAGALPGVTTIFQALCYFAAGGAGCREHTGILSGAKRAADYNVYWGEGGVVDSVIDVTHNIPVPFYADHVSSSWGILNPGAQTGTSPDGSATLTDLDFACVEPFRTHAAGDFVCPDGTPAYALSQTAVPGAVGFFSGSAYPPDVPIVPAASAGFGFYIAGDKFTIELEGGALPADGTVWALRQYVGAITGGQGAAGDQGPYAFSNPEGILPYAAIGTELRSQFTIDSRVAAATKNDLREVHTVPDPYYVRSAFEASTEQKVLKFVGLPEKAIVRIYSVSGVLVRMLEHDASRYSATSASQGNEMIWDLRNRNNQVVASGVYFYHVEAGDARRVGRFTVVNFAQ